MGRYRAIFDGYDFTNETKKILLKHIRGDWAYLKDGYMVATEMEAESLIGEVAIGRSINFVCDFIDMKDRAIRKVTDVIIGV